MSQKSTESEEQSSQKEESKPVSLAKEDPYVVYEGEDKKEDSPSVPSVIIGSPLGESQYNDDSFLKMVKRAIDQSLPIFNEEREESFKDYQLEHDDNSNESNPPPLALPPLGTEYDDSFIEMVKRVVNRNYRSTNDEEQQNHINDQLFGSIITFGEDDNRVVPASQKQEDDDDDDERRVENPRRALTTLENVYSDEDPVLSYSLEGPLFFDDKPNELKQSSSQKYVVLKKDPLHVNDLEYVASKKPVQSPPEKDELDLPVISKQSQLELERDPEQQPKSDDDDQNSQSSSQDFSSWLCFDSNDEFQKFKDTIASENLQLDIYQDIEDANKEREDIFPLYSDEDDENKLLIEQIFSGKFSPGEIDEDSFSSVDIEKYIINMSTPKRDIVSTRESQSPRAEEPIPVVSSSPHEDGNKDKVRPDASIVSSQEAVNSTSELKDQKDQDKDKKNNSTNKKDSDVFYTFRGKTKAETARPTSSDDIDTHPSQPTFPFSYTRREKDC